MSDESQEPIKNGQTQDKFILAEILSKSNLSPPINPPKLKLKTQKSQAIETTPSDREIALIRTRREKFRCLGKTAEHWILLLNERKSVKIYKQEQEKRWLGMLIGMAIERRELAMVVFDMEVEACEASQGDLNSLHDISNGIHEFESGKWLVVSSNDFFLIDAEGKVEQLISPLYRGEILFNRKAEKYSKRYSWMDSKVLRNSADQVQNDSDKTKAKLLLTGCLKKLTDHISKWNFDHDVSKYLSATVAIAGVHCLLKHRPFLFITGKTASGKTAFIERVLEWLWGAVIKRLDKGTKAAVYQSLGESNYIPVFDEAEKNRNLKDILENFKLGSSKGGGIIPRGTVSGETIEFYMQHTPWMFGIFPPAELESDASLRNRFLIFRLKPLTADPNPMPEEEGMELAADLLISMRSLWTEIQESADLFSKKSHEMVRNSLKNLDHRHIENLMYLSAIWEVATGEPLEIPEWICREDHVDDGDMILEVILNKKVRVRFENFDAPLSWILGKVLAGKDHSTQETKDSLGCLDFESGKTTLLQHGLKVGIQTRELYLDPAQLRGLVRDSIYQDQNVKEALLRIEGARFAKVNWMGTEKGHQKGNRICIPLTSIPENLKNFPLTEETENASKIGTHGT